MKDNAYNKESAKDYFNTHPMQRTLSMKVPQNYAPHVKAAELYQEMLAEVGVDVTITLLDWASWLRTVYQDADFDMTVIGHTGKTDPDTVLRMFGEGQSYLGWHNEEFASLIKDARTEVTQKKRIDLYRKSLTIMAERLPMITIGQAVINVVIDRAVSGIKVDPILNTFDFRSVQLQQ